MVFPMSIAALDTLCRSSGPDLLDRLNAGVPISVFRHLAVALDVSSDLLAQALGLSARTLRNRQRRLTADETERSFRAYRVLLRAQEVIGSEEGARAWLVTGQKALGGRSPLSMLIRDVGVDEVMNLLNAIEDGGYL